MRGADLLMYSDTMGQFCAHVNRTLYSLWLLILAVNVRTNKILRQQAATDVFP